MQENYESQSKKSAIRDPQSKIDIVLLDLGLPDSQGLDTFARAYAHAPEVPIIVLTSSDDESLALEAVRKGAQDYLVKGEIDRHTLTLSMRYAIERKHVVLRDGEARLRNIIEKNVDGIIIVDGNGIVRFVNPAGEALFGQKAEEFLEQLFGFPVVAGETVEIDIVRSTRERVIAEMRVVETEWRGEKAYLLSLRDITERKRMEEALRESEVRYRETVSNIPGFVYQLLRKKDDSISFPFVGKNSSTMLGLSPEEIMADPSKFFGRVALEDLAKVNETLSESAQTMKTWTVEFRVREKGEIKWLRSSANPRLLPDGSILWNGVVFDVTKEKEVDRMKSEFISVVSHELRTPLSSLKNAVHVMLQETAGAVNENQRRFLSLAMRNIDKLAKAINDLLDLSRLESGKIEIRSQEVDLEDPLDTVISSLRPQAEDKSLIIGKEIEVGLPKIYGDEDKIKTIFTHLINNAIKFTPEGGSITVAARLAHSPDKLATEGQKLNEKLIEISVVDNGTGIPPHELGKIFDRFYQVQKSLTREIGGSGIGLSIVKDLVEKHRGWIWVESKVGKGSRFVFTLPRYIPPEGP
jgi:signal transduction histidine kinase